MPFSEASSLYDLGKCESPQIFIFKFYYNYKTDLTYNIKVLTI